MKGVSVYLAGGLFNAGERLHNLFLKRALTEVGKDMGINCYVTLPQQRALRFFDGKTFDIAGIVEDCRVYCENPNVVFVGSADGADPDSGTSVEYGIAITKQGKAVIYRTDFRTAPEKEVGLNAMFRIEGTVFIYEPCFFTELDEVEQYYRELARKILEGIKE